MDTLVVILMTRHAEEWFRNNQQESVIKHQAS